MHTYIHCPFNHCSTIERAPTTIHIVLPARQGNCLDRYCGHVAGCDSTTGLTCSQSNGTSHITMKCYSHQRSCGQTCAVSKTETNRLDNDTHQEMGPHCYARCRCWTMRNGVRADSQYTDVGKREGKVRNATLQE